jgi:hypothetical protein
MAIRLEILPYEGPSGRLEGLVAYDDTEPPRPGVLIIHTALGRSVFEDEVARPWPARATPPFPPTSTVPETPRPRSTSPWRPPPAWSEAPAASWP